MTIIIIIFLIIFIIASPTLQCIVFHPFATIKNGLVDTINYFKYKKWNNAKFGFVDCYTALDSKAFGCGKTLTSVNRLANIYRKKNDKMVWCNERKKFVKQKIVIFSMVHFKNIPYIKLVSLGQFISYLHERYEKDKEEDIMTITYLYIDEAGSVFNSRSFKDNFDPLSIKTFLTSRHFKASIVMTAQRFGMVDALARQITNKVIACDLWWRFQRLSYYDAYEMENAQNPAAVKPYKKKCIFITNKKFNEYDTYELLEDIKKKCDEGDMMTEEEILAHQANIGPNMDTIINTSRKYRKSRKKMQK